jgi:hypothetical protein
MLTRQKIWEKSSVQLQLARIKRVAKLSVISDGLDAAGKYALYHCRDTSGVSLKTALNCEILHIVPGRWPRREGTPEPERKS